MRIEDPQSPDVPEPSQREVANLIAERLGETESSVLEQLFLVVKFLGRTKARSLLAEVIALENEGGMMLPDGTRRRTIGGVYFNLAKRAMTLKQRNKFRFFQARTTQKLDESPVDAKGS